LLLLICCITFIDLYIESSLHLWNETNLIMVYDHFGMLLNLVYLDSFENFS
jgi:hypothetical protein